MFIFKVAEGTCNYVCSIVTQEQHTVIFQIYACSNVKNKTCQTTIRALFVVTIDERFGVTNFHYLNRAEQQMSSWNRKLKNYLWTKSNSLNYNIFSFCKYYVRHFCIIMCLYLPLHKWSASDLMLRQDSVDQFIKKKKKFSMNIYLQRQKVSSAKSVWACLWRRVSKAWPLGPSHYVSWSSVINFWVWKTYIIFLLYSTCYLISYMVNWVQTCIGILRIV